jgi:hypothetical protein
MAANYDDHHHAINESINKSFTSYNSRQAMRSAHFRSRQASRPLSNPRGAARAVGEFEQGQQPQSGQGQQGIRCAITRGAARAVG